MYGVVTDDNGLYYMRARYYNVSIKRFINQDIVNGSITNSQSLNKFSYVQGNPIKLTDPFGLFLCISLSGIGHAALSLLGVIPGLDFCDAINAAWYYAEGDYANASISMVAALPYLGSVAGTGIKFGIKSGTKAQKIAETVKLGSRIAGGAGGFIVSGAQAVETVKNIHANSGKDGDASWSNVGDYLTLGLSIAGMGLAGASIAKSGATLKTMWNDELAIVSAAVRNTTKKVISYSKNKVEYLIKDNSGMVKWNGIKRGRNKSYGNGHYPQNPDELLEQGWREKTHPNNKSGNRDFENPKTGEKIHYDKGVPGANGFKGKDHYHRYNPNSSNNSDLYLDKCGNPTSKGSKPSHILPE